MSVSRTLTTKKRATALDIARGFMLLLIVLAHAPLYLYGVEPGIMSQPLSTNASDKMINFISHLFVENRARPMFAALFGYGMMLVLQRQLDKGTTIKEAKRLQRRRAYFLILFGFVLEVIVGGDDILAPYGIASLLLGWLLLRGNRALFKVLVVVSVFFLIWLPLGWMFIAHEMGGLTLGNEISSNHTYFVRMFASFVNFPIMLVFVHLMFPVLIPVMVGMWAARNELLTKPHQHLKKLVWISIIGVSISIVGALPLATYGLQLWEPTPYIAGLIYACHMMTGFAGGFGYAALFGVIAVVLKHPGGISRALTALGKRSLTFYIFNETMLVFILSPAFLNLGMTLTATGGAAIAVLIWSGALGLAVVLEKKQIQGPIDKLLRYLVYR
ncbi:hypothetical protein BALCAV_0219985 [Alkalihalobacillus alcalophilus ATCC 27647 = CGMCC 1.3604]|uniref:DUF418 domain-containing protein n=1 Tax=Alkalihalobacillus alcalophilus ATCC 27647 = CGMCC 1.3604 TaxID=1218173 RepID=A0A094WIS8_ALKAL|nr:hypothetical protein BALCAV_0219985 [Alkalihalobacillus alcalophilus ATCC 27647 = CGMCC 1.3604]